MPALKTLLANKGRRVLLLSPPGGGKTGAIAQLARHKELFILDTDGNYLPYLEYLPEEFHKNLHIEPVRDQTTFDDSGRVRPLGPPRAWANMIQLLKSSWIDSETKQNFGNISSWGPEKVLVVDTVSNLDIPAWNHVLTLNSTDTTDRFKYRPRINDWQDAIDLQKALVVNLARSHYRCHIIFSTHLKHLRVSEKPTEEEQTITDAERARKKVNASANLSEAATAAAEATGPMAMAARQRAERAQRDMKRAEQSSAASVGTVHTFERYPNALGNQFPAELGKDFDFMLFMEKKGAGKPRIRTTPLEDVALKCPSAKLSAYLSIEDGLNQILNK